MSFTTPPYGDNEPIPRTAVRANDFLTADDDAAFVAGSRDTGLILALLLIGGENAHAVSLATIGNLIGKGLAEVVLTDTGCSVVDRAVAARSRALARLED